MIKEKRGDILCLTWQQQEDPNVIGEVADLIVNSDNIAMGYIMPAAAKKLGAKQNLRAHILPAPYELRAAIAPPQDNGGGL